MPGLRTPLASNRAIVDALVDGVVTVVITSVGAVRRIAYFALNGHEKRPFRGLYVCLPFALPIVVPIPAQCRIVIFAQPSVTSESLGVIKTREPAPSPGIAFLL